MKILFDKQKSNECLFSTKDVLGYTRNEIVGQWFGRYLATNDLEKFEAIRRTYRK